MNENRIFKDGFQQSFAQETGFITFLKEREKNANWSKTKANVLRFAALDEDTSKTRDISEDYVEASENILIQSQKISAVSAK